MVPEIIQSLASTASAKDLLVEVYGDLAKPGVSQVGKALGTVVGIGNTILWPIQLLNERAKIALEANLERYREKMASVPIENVSEVAPEIGVPVAEKLSYVSDTELRELYTSLLYKASNTETLSQAHPSFVNILNNLSPDEARLLQQFQKQVGSTPFISAKYTKMASPNERHSLQFIDCHFAMSKETKILFIENLQAYISNLEGLGLINVRKDVLVVPKDCYPPLEDDLRLKYRDAPRPAGYTDLQFDRGKIEVSNFGWLFLRCCAD